LDEDTMPAGPAPAPAGSFDASGLAAKSFADLREATADQVGILRPGYGPGEQKALELVKEVAEQHGLETAWDDCANLVITLDGAQPDLPYVVCGSHLDAVPQGGNYDGAAGVIAGVVCLARMRAERVIPPRTLKVIALRAEESAWFGKPCLGSSALFGQLTAEDLALKSQANGRTLADCMREYGAGVDRISRREKLLAPGSVAAYFELHIEQGPVMVARGFPVAVVTGIRGNIRHRSVRCVGEAGHSGAVPRWLRRDAVFAAADLISRLDEHWRVLLERGLDLVVTTGIIGTNAAEHAMSRIPGEVDFSFEVRSQSLETLEAFYHLMRAECRSISAARWVEFHFDRRFDSAPARMDAALVERLRSLCKNLGLPTETIPSGAGHDASIFANQGIPSAMIFIRNANGSHNPREAMDLDDFLQGTELLYHALLEVQ
jgi:N-carbamoyl-L-amino-acid hydrolase